MTAPQSAGGKALAEKLGPEHMKRIGAEGGHATVARYGVGYMSQIGSAGAIARLAKRVLPRLEEALISKGVENDGQAGTDR